MPRSALFAALLLSALFLTACKKPTSGAPSGAATAPDTANLSAVDLYNSKNYPDALARAEQDMLTTKDRAHEVAQLTAGLAAYALNKPALAQTYLEPLTGSADTQIAGRAEAVLGQIADKRGNRQYAADLYKRASTKLEGDDSTRASARAGKSLASGVPPRSAWRPDSALARAPDATRSVAVPKAAPDATRSVAVPKFAPDATRSVAIPKSGQCTIQVAAFASRAGAQKKVAQLRPATIKAGLGSPRIVADTINGKPGFAVHVGLFPSRPDAEAAKPKLGAGQYMIVAAN